MKTLKTIFCIIIWIVIGWICLQKITQGMRDEDLISAMPQSTYDEIEDTLTAQNGVHPSEHHIVTYYYEKYNK